MPRPSSSRSAVSASGSLPARQGRRAEEREEGVEEEREEDVDEPEQDIQRKVHDLVRLALFTEYRRQPLRRDDAAKKILGTTSSRAFPDVLEKAQKILRSTFGYELVQMRAKGEGISAATGQEDEGAVRKKAPPKSYILRSTLPKALIEAAETSDGDLALLEREDVDDDDQDGSGGGRGEGIMLDWKGADEQRPLVGLLFVILSLIMVNGRVLADDQLHAYLRRLNLHSSEPLASTISSQHDPSSTAATPAHASTLDGYLSLLQRQSYLEKSKSPVAQAGATQTQTQTQAASAASRGGRSQTGRGGGGEEGDFGWEWRWGARADIEIGEVAVAEFIGEVFFPGHDSEQEEQEEEEEGPVLSRRGTARVTRRAAGQSSQGAVGRNAAAVREKAVARLVKDLQRAAGSQLQE